MLRSVRSVTADVSIQGGGAPRRLVLAATAVLALALLAAAPALAEPTFEDLSGGAYQILAPGEQGTIVPGEFSTDQGKLYDKLTKVDLVSQAKLEEDYVSEKFGAQGSPIGTELPPEPGLEIVRDKHDIPHIYGTTRAAVMFGSGWVAGKDRTLLLELGLGPSYAAALSIPGVNAFELLLTERSFTPSAEAVKFVEEQKKVLIEAGAEGEQVIQDLENWCEGVNAYRETLVEPQLPHCTFADAIAGFAFIGSIFGNGGGEEVANDNFLAGLEAKFGPTEGLKIFRDLREVNDPEAATTAAKAFPYDTVPTGATPGSPLIDRNSLSSEAVQSLASTKASRRKASNFLLVGPGDSKSGHPIAVMGPQLGYFYPEIVMQGDLHGPGIDAEGIIAPISPYVFIGRGRDFAWSLTSAGSENTMQFLEELCNPEAGEVTRESEYYEYKGECIKMKTFDAGTIGPGNGEEEHEVFFKESVHGPISGTVTIGGKPYAIANDRSTRGREPAGELAFSALDSDQVHSPEQFFEAANKLETTFNMAYIDSKHAAYFSAGRLPKVAPGTDPSLPTLGTGQYDWQGFLSLEEHPHEIDPASNFFTNWNNKPAPEWGAASDNWTQGTVQRVQLYTGFKKRMTEANDATIMNRAATQDLRGLLVWPYIEKVLQGGPAPSPLAEEAAGLIDRWVSKGAHRKGAQHPADPGAAVMDAVWRPIARTVLGSVLGEELTNELESIAGVDNPPNSEGSAFGGGWYGYVQKNLREELGEPVSAPFSREFCGEGNLATCRAELWSDVQQAAEELEATQGSNLKKWRAAKVRIEFPPDPLMHYTMEWTNRSTFQQVIEFSGQASG